MSDPMTIEQVRERLGLEPFDEFAAKARAWLEQFRADFGRTLKFDPDRGTGKTVRALCEALAVASTGRIALVTGEWKWLRDHHLRSGRDMARELGIDPNLLQPGPIGDERPPAVGG